MAAMGRKGMKRPHRMDLRFLPESSHSSTVVFSSIYLPFRPKEDIPKNLIGCTIRISHYSENFDFTPDSFELVLPQRLKVDYRSE